MSRNPFPPCGRPHCGQHVIHIAFWKRLVGLGLQWPSGPKAEIRLYYDCNLFKTVLLVIYIGPTNWYRKNIPLFIPFNDEILVEKTPNSLHEKKTGWRQWTLILILCVNVHIGLDPLPVHMRPPEPDPSPPPPCERNKWMALTLRLSVYLRTIIVYPNCGND